MLEQLITNKAIRYTRTTTQRRLAQKEGEKKYNVTREVVKFGESMHYAHTHTRNEEDASQGKNAHSRKEGRRDVSRGQKKPRSIRSRGQSECEL